MKLLRLLLLLLAFSGLLAGAGPRLAHADAEASSSSPPDVPLVVAPSGVSIPPVPADYVTRDLGWLVVKYVASAEERTAPLVAAAAEVKAKLAAELGQTVLDHVEVRVARSPEEMAQLAPAGLPPPAYATGVAYPPLKLVLLSLRAPDSAEAANLDEVFRHELSHVALEDAVQGQHVPRWFNEGLAVYESGESSFGRLRTLWDATLSRSLLPLSELDRGFPSDKVEVSIAYAESADFVRFLLRRADHQRALALIERVRDGEVFDRALADAYGTDMRKIEYEWRQDLDKRYTVWPMITGGSFVWVLTIGALGWAYVARRRRSKRTLEMWAREEAASDESDRLAALTALDAARVLATAPAPAPVADESRPPRCRHQRLDQAPHDRARRIVAPPSLVRFRAATPAPQRRTVGQPAMTRTSRMSPSRTDWHAVPSSVTVAPLITQPLAGSCGTTASSK